MGTDSRTEDVDSSGPAAAREVFTGSNKLVTLLPKYSINIS
jgi:hypothetical protein